VRGRGVRPCVGKRTEARAFVCDLRQRVQEVACRARQPVKARDHQHVAFLKLADRAAELGAVGIGSARLFPKHLLRSGGAKLLHLSVNALAIR
jgi:hypothetical protein